MGNDKGMRQRFIRKCILGWSAICCSLLLLLSSVPVYCDELFTISAFQNVGGTVSPCSAIVNRGGSQTFTITPADGNNIAFVLVDGVSKGAVPSYTFSDVTKNHTITAGFTSGSLTSQSSVNYFYDPLGRLIRSVVETTGALFTYDDVGNLITTTIETSSGGSPSLTAIYPAVLFVGTKTRVEITGSSLLTTDSLTASQGLVSITNLNVSNSKIIAEMTALAPGTEMLTVTTRTGTPNTASLSILLSSSHFSLSPGQLPMVPGGSGMVTASINPPLPITFTTDLFNDAPSVVTVQPSITIPTNGSATFAIDALQEGSAIISAAAIAGAKSVALVGPPFSGDVNGFTSRPVSVRVGAPQDGVASTASRRVSVYINEPTSLLQSLTARPVSADVTIPTGNSSINSGGVSVKTQ